MANDQTTLATPSGPIDSPTDYVSGVAPTTIAPPAGSTTIGPNPQDDPNDPEYRSAASVVSRLSGRVWNAIKEGIPAFNNKFEAAAHTDTGTLANGETPKEQLITPEAAMTPKERKAHPILTGVGESLGGFTSPESAIMMAGTGGFGELPGAAGKLIPKLISLKFSADAIKGAYAQIPDFKAAMDRGDESEAERIIAHIVMDTAVGADIGQHATKGAFGEGLGKLDTGRTITKGAEKAPIEISNQVESSAAAPAKDFSSVGGVKVERRAPGSLGRTPGSVMKKVTDATYSTMRAHGLDTASPESPAEPSGKFAPVGGVEQRTATTFGRTGGAFGNTVDKTFDVLRAQADAEKAPVEISNQVNASTATTPQKKPFVGVHYSPTPLENEVISGARRGEAAAGSEKSRLEHDNRVPGAYFYREGAPQESQIRSRGHVATVTGDKSIADIGGAQKATFEDAVSDAVAKYKAAGDNDTIATQKAINDGEAHLRSLGFDGYENAKNRAGTVFLFGDHPVDQPHVDLSSTYGDTGTYLAHHVELQAGVDFPSNFENDNFTVRRTQGNNMFDPEAFITGDEMAKGMTYKNSHRNFPNEDAYQDAVMGVKGVTVEDVAKKYPRVFNEEPVSGTVPLQAGGVGDFASRQERDHALGEGVTHGPALLETPKHLVGDNQTTQSVISHELGHIIAAHLMGVPTEESFIGSHISLHSKITGGAAYANFDFSKLPGGVRVGDAVRFTPDALVENFPRLMHTLLGGGAAEELIHGIPMEDNAGMGGDLRQLRGIFRSLGFDPIQADAALARGKWDTKALLNKPEILDIIKNASQTREEGLSKTLHMSKERVQSDIIQKLNEVTSGKRSDDLDTRAGDTAGTVRSADEGIGQAASSREGQDTGGAARGNESTPVQQSLFSSKAPVVEEPENEETPYSKIVDLHTKNGGSTWNLAQDKNLSGTDNYAVATHPDRTLVVNGELTPETVEMFAEKNADLLKDPTESLGTWNDKQNNQHVLDIVKTIPDRAEAVRLGFENKQDAIYDLKKTDGSGEIFMKNEKSPNADIPQSKRVPTPKGSTVALMSKPLNIEGTGPGGNTTLLDLAGALNEWSQNGLKPNKEIEVALNRAKAEMQYQIAQDNNGTDWYKRDTKDAIDTFKNNGFPELENPTQEKLFRVLWGITSYGVDPDVNLTSAAEAYKKYKQTGTVPLTANSTTNWPGYSGIQGSITILNKLLEEKGEQGTMDWLLSKHPVSELREQKLKTHGTHGVPGKAGDEKEGMFIFGPKAGAFALNLQGVSDHTTVDVWGARMIRRWTGKLTPETMDQPVTPEEARNFHSIVQKVGKQFGLDTADAQAVLWGYEHDLYKAHGVGESAKSYKGAAEKYVQKSKEGSVTDYIQEQRDVFREGHGDSVGKAKSQWKGATPRQSAPDRSKAVAMSRGLSKLAAPRPQTPAE